MTMTALPGRSFRRANGTLMARRAFGSAGGRSGQQPTLGLTWAFWVERAKGIEPS